MPTSILGAAKETLGIQAEDKSFDTELVIHINSVLADLNDFGVGPADGFSVTSEQEDWETFLGSDKKLNTAVSYMYLRLRLLFDPPSTGPAMDSFSKQADQMAWRLQNRVETGSVPDPIEIQ